MNAMKYLLLLLLFIGCKEKNTTNPVQPDEQRCSVNLIFKSGFQSDSVVVKSDSKIVYTGIAKSDSILGSFPNECVFTVSKGSHILSIEIPLESISSETSFFAGLQASVRIYAHFNRNNRTITYVVYYIVPY